MTYDPAGRLRLHKPVRRELLRRAFLYALYQIQIINKQLYILRHYI